MNKSKDFADYFLHEDAIKAFATMLKLMYDQSNTLGYVDRPSLHLQELQKKLCTYYLIKVKHLVSLKVLVYVRVTRKLDRKKLKYNDFFEPNVKRAEFILRKIAESFFGIKNETDQRNTDELKTEIDDKNIQYFNALKLSIDRQNILKGKIRKELEKGYCIIDHVDEESVKNTFFLQNEDVSIDRLINAKSVIEDDYYKICLSLLNFIVESRISSIILNDPTSNVPAFDDPSRFEMVDHVKELDNRITYLENIVDHSSNYFLSNDSITRGVQRLSEYSSGLLRETKPSPHMNWMVAFRILGRAMSAYASLSDYLLNDIERFIDQKRLKIVVRRKYLIESMDE